MCCVLVFSRKEGDYAKFRQIRITKSSAFHDWSYRKVGLYGHKYEKRESTIFATFVPRVCASDCLTYNPRDEDQENTVGVGINIEKL